MKKRIKKVIEEIKYNDTYQIAIIIILMVAIIIPIAIYVGKNTSYETYYTKGVVIDRDRWQEIIKTRDSEGVYHYRYETHYETQVKIISENYIFTDRSYYAYSHSTINQNVEVKVTQKYWKGKYRGSNYEVR